MKDAGQIMSADLPSTRALFGCTDTTLGNVPCVFYSLAMVVLVRHTSRDRAGCAPALPRRSLGSYVARCQRACRCIVAQFPSIACRSLRGDLCHSSLQRTRLRACYYTKLWPVKWQRSDTSSPAYLRAMPTTETSVNIRPSIPPLTRYFRQTKTGLAVPH